MDKIAVVGRGRRNVTSLEAKLGVLSWLAPMVVISLLVAHDPQRRTVTPLYHAAAAAWGAGKDLYLGPGGMNYLPQFAVLFYPFHRLPAPLGDILWRWLEAVLLAAGVWSLSQDLAGNQRGGLRRENSFSTFAASRVFFYASLLVMPLCLAALRNGQANAMLAGLALCAAASIARRRWWSAAVLIALATGIKPLGIVMLLLAATAYGPLRLRLLITVAALFLLPFVFGSPGYVTGQFHAFFENIGKCAVVHEDRFADIGGIVRTFGLELPRQVSVIVRFAAGPLFLGLWLPGARRLREPLRAMWLLALAACYLMLFNPMNEANGYVILAPALGLWAVAALTNSSTRWFGWMSVSICVSMSILPNVLHPVFGNYFALFWHPFMTILFIVALAWLVLRKAKSWSGGKADSDCEGLEQTSSGSFI